MSYDKYQKANHETQNWKELYVKAYGVDPAHLAEAAELWGPEQEKNKRVPEMFEGMTELIRDLKPIPLGICSQNNRVQIEKTLEHYGIRDCFEGIIGTLEVPIAKQKPDAEGLALPKRPGFLQAQRNRRAPEAGREKGAADC